MRYLFFSILILSTCVFSAKAQSSSEQATELISRAISYMDNGNIDESIALLQKAQQIDPENINIPYEIAYAYQLGGEFDKCIKMAKPLLKQKDVFDQVYQLIGNAYDLKGDPQKAIKIYDKGLKKFPKSGKLYLEKGVVLAKQNMVGDAFDVWESGIVADPNHSSNYYYATQVLADSREKIWAIYYGEIFLNLEPSTKRSIQISKLLYDIYKDCLPVENGKWGLNFSYKSTNITITMGDLNSGNFLNQMMSFETVHNLAMEQGYKDVSPEFELGNLFKIRKQFLEKWMKDYQKLHQNIVFDYHQLLVDNEKFEPYFFWLLKEGSPKEFEVWKTENNKRYEEFLLWFEENPMNISGEQKSNRLDFQ